MLRGKCLGAAAGLMLVLSVPSARAMIMEVVENQAILSGEVVRGDLFRFTTLLDQNRQIDTVILRNSHGGDSRTGYDIGATIRNHRLITAVSGYCESSCSRMFLGGVERRFASDTAPGKTRVGLHGNYEHGDGRLSLSAMEQLQKFIAEYTGGKADPELVKRWTQIPNRKGMIYFFDSSRLKRKDGISVFLCDGDEARDNRFNECEKIPDRTGYDLGIFTSTELVVPKK